MFDCRWLIQHLDEASEQAESDMTAAFGCLGEPLATAFSEAVHGLEALLPDGSEHVLAAYKLPVFQNLCDIMTDLRSDLDERIDRLANLARERGFEEAKQGLPDGSSLQAGDHGVDLNSSLEDAFAAGVDSVSRYIDDVDFYPGSESYTMEDL